ncbi:M23 family metallopeptidase [Bacteroidales bacterium]|nr:M23 family metallopeptidase [Bacteroidales bacterium]
MSRNLYRLNKKTLQYEVISHGKKEKAFAIAKNIALVITFGFLINWLFAKYVGNLDEAALQKENKKLVESYDSLLNRIFEKYTLVDYLKRNDDNVYRPILNEDPLAEEVRVAGFGGSKINSNIVNAYHDVIIETAKEIDKLGSIVRIQKSSYDKIEKLAERKEKFLDCYPGISPMSIKDFGRYSDYFRYRSKHPVTGRSAFHRGLDMTGSIGSPIHATGNGVVTRAKYVIFYGKMIEIDHGFGYKTRYAHLNDINVKAGQSIKRGEKIGELGETGRVTGPHLHYEVRINERAVNPLDYFSIKDLTAEEYNEMILYICSK